jgi:hypothetical protein
MESRIAGSIARTASDAQILCALPYCIGPKDGHTVMYNTDE